MAETLEPFTPENISFSVILSALLHSNDNFNAIQIIIDSSKFDLSEPLVFHARHCSIDGYSIWSVIIIDPISIGMLLDSFDSGDSSSSFNLVKTLLTTSGSTSTLRLAFELLPLPKQLNPRAQDWYFLTAVRSTDALSFLFGCSQVIDMYDKLFDSSEANKRVLDLVKTFLNTNLNLCGGNSNFIGKRPRLSYERSYYPFKFMAAHCPFIGMRKQLFADLLPLLSAYM